MDFNVVRDSPVSYSQSELNQSLAGVRSLHVENGSGDPLENCLRLEKVIRGIKRVQGLEVRPRRPITATILRQISSTPQP